ncbi:MAG TPA: hypothetical protein VIU46_00175 [Gallionellaceae bacterium]
MDHAASRRRGAPLPALLAGLALPLVLSGCATYSDSFAPIQSNLASQKYDAALKDIEKQSGSKTDRVLYLLNKGMVLRMKRDFAGSNQALEAAKAEMERLYAASVSQNAMSFLINDSTVSYGGEDYEQVLVHLYMALNYLELGQKYEARVEAQQVDIKLREISSKVSGNRYARDAFTLYLTGMIYEDLGERSDAMISYRDAYNAYKKYQSTYGTPIPDDLKVDLLRLTQRLGLRDEAAQYSKEFGLALAPGKSDPPKEGDLVFIFNNGLVPIKREKRAAMVAPPPSAMTGNAPTTPGVYVTIALPYYESRPNNVVAARISASDKQASTEPAENMDAIARASLDSHMAAITARSIARAVIKAKIQESVDRAGQNRNNDSGAALLGSIFVRVAAVATERADTRSWLTLPAEIQLARLHLPPGTYTIKVELLDAGGQTVNAREYPGIVITEGHMTYLTEHWTPPFKPSPARR